MKRETVNENQIVNAKENRKVFICWRKTIIEDDRLIFLGSEFHNFGVITIYLASVGVGTGNRAYKVV